MTNYRKETAPVQVMVSFGGVADSASDEGKIAINDYDPEDWDQGSGYPGANNHSEIAWQVNLEPGQSKTLTYKSHLFVR